MSIEQDMINEDLAREAAEERGARRDAMIDDYILEILDDPYQLTEVFREVAENTERLGMMGKQALAKNEEGATIILYDIIRDEMRAHAGRAVDAEME